MQSGVVSYFKYFHSSPQHQRNAHHSMGQLYKCQMYFLSSQLWNSNNAVKSRFLRAAILGVLEKIISKIEGSDVLFILCPYRWRCENQFLHFHVWDTEKYDL